MTYVVTYHVTSKCVQPEGFGLDSIGYKDLSCGTPILARDVASW